MVGRERELGVVLRFLSGDAGAGAALVLEGEAGIGKTVLWEASLDAARERGARVLVARASEEEARFGFAGLTDLLEGVEPEILGDLPGPQRRALEIALLRREADRVSDARAASAAVLGVLRALAGAGTVVVAVDDVGWLDSESAGLLRFAARRLANEPVRFLFTCRGSPERPVLLEWGLAAERLVIAPLSFGATCRMWGARLGVTLSRPVSRRLYDTAGGNPLFALELARAVAVRGGAIPVSGDIPLPAAIEIALSDRLGSMTELARQALLAVELSGAVRAGELAGVVTEVALEQAVDAELLRRDGERLRLAHPLFGAVAATRSKPAERREMHRRLASVAHDAERRAHHLAMAMPGQDAEAAMAVAAAAAAARRRGSAATAAALGEQALRLTPSGASEHALRLIAAADHHNAAGNLLRSTELLLPALEAMPPGSLRASALLLLADGTTGDADTRDRYLIGALEEAADDRALRARVLSTLALNAGLARVADVRRAYDRAQEAVGLAAAVGDPGGELEALAALLWLCNLRGLSSEDVLARCETLDSEMPMPVHNSVERARAVRLIWRGELAAARTILAELLAVADERDETESHFVIRLQLCELELRAGGWGSVQELLEEWSLQREEAAGSPAAFARCVALAAAGRGKVDEARRAAEDAVAAAEAIGVAWHRLEALRAGGVAELLAGDAAAAADKLRVVWNHTRTQGVEDPGAFPVAPDLVEALCTLEALDEAAEVTATLIASAERQDHAWGRATATRCHGLLALARREDANAAAALEHAVADYEALGMPFDQARALTALGTAYRRMRRRADARGVLEQAAEILERLGSPGWAQRTRQELGRIGGRRRTGRLTPAEQRVAELVSQGKANKQIAAELVVTVGTVEGHLTQIYATLGVRSRGELMRLLLSD